MDAPALIRTLARNADVIRTVLEATDPEAVRWKPTPKRWSALEVARHLADEEREDFRVRIDFTLHRPTEAWPPIDPEGWVTERRYNEGELEETIADFLRERKRSVEWLEGLDRPRWQTEHTHSQFGSMAAGTLLVSWVAHDALHLRQLARLQFLFTERLGSPYLSRYAGEW